MIAPRSVLIAHPGADLYGSDRVMLETVEAMLQRGWRVTVTVPALGPLVPELQRRGAQVEFCPTPVLRKSVLSPLGAIRVAWVTIRSIPRAISLIRRSRAELVYVSTLTIPLWILVTRVLRRPVVCHVHESERSTPLLVRRVLSAPLMLATGLIVNSHYCGRVLGESYRKLQSRAEVIYNGIPGPDRTTPARESLDSPLRLLFVGRLSPRKGPQVAVDLVRRLIERGVPASLEIMGSVFPGYEWFEAELREAVGRFGLGDRVDFVGFNPEVWPHFERADIVLVPSQGDESFGNIAVEAVLSARPVIVSGNSGLEEAVAGYESAQTVAAADLDAWTGAIVDVVTGWSHFRAEAGADAVSATRRHSLTLYREHMASSLVHYANDDNDRNTLQRDRRAPLGGRSTSEFDGDN
jgi:glycosyltransferase involved in cell wall biosynthesis